MSHLFSRPTASLTTSVFYVLLSLSSEDRHRTEILRDVTLSSAGRVKMGLPGLNATLRRLSEAGLVVSVDNRYRLTRGGRAELAIELEKLARSRRR